MSSEGTNYGVVVGVDGTAGCRPAVAWAAEEAALRTLPITLLHAITPLVVSWPVGPVQASIAEWQEQQAYLAIEEARQTVQSATGGVPMDIRTETVSSSAVSTLVDASKTASILVVGSRGAGALSRALLGSVSSGVTHHAHCPVAVIRAGEAPAEPNAPVVLGIDGSPASEAATEWAFDEAARRGVDLIALHAWSDIAVFPALGMDWRDRETEGQEILAERLAGWQEQYPDVKVHRRIVCDQPARRLLEESANAQLVVVGSHGRGGFSGMLLGSVSSAVSQAATVPVLVVRDRFPHPAQMPSS